MTRPNLQLVSNEVKEEDWTCAECNRTWAHDVDHCGGCGNVIKDEQEWALNAIRCTKNIRRPIGAVECGDSYQCSFVITGFGSTRTKWGPRPNLKLNEDVFMTLSNPMIRRMRRVFGSDQEQWIGKPIEIRTVKCSGKSPLMFAFRDLSKSECPF